MTKLDTIVFAHIVTRVAAEHGITREAANQYASLSFAFMTHADKVRFAKYHNLIPNVATVATPSTANTVDEARKVVSWLSHNSLCALERNDEDEYATLRTYILNVIDKWNLFNEQTELVQRGMDTYDKAYFALRS